MCMGNHQGVHQDPEGSAGTITPGHLLRTVYVVHGGAARSESSRKWSIAGTWHCNTPSIAKVLDQDTRR
jgi:hypothetical protein